VRAVWLAGEVAGPQAAGLLLAAARAPDAELRRLCAFALAKAASALSAQADEAQRVAPLLQQALTELLSDADDDVRRHAEAAIERLMGPAAE
jgi:hypothetical protein